jgi:hypothetical protein
MAAGTTRWRGIISSAAIALAIAAVGCGSDDGAPSEDARLDPALAERLAVSSEAVADSLDSGDTCGAAEAADELAAEVSAAEMPEELRAEAASAAAELVNTVNCEPELEEKQKKDEEKDEEKDEDDGEGDGEGSSGPGPGPPGQGGELPPGLEQQGSELGAGGFD